MEVDQLRDCPEYESMSSLEVIIIDYGSGNLRSVARAVEKANAIPRISSDPAQVENADALILPGVGAGDAAMRSLGSRNLVKSIQAYAGSGRPFLGVCLGLQLLCDRTDEGDARCLEIVRGQVKKLPPDLKVPHMGWNRVHFKASNPLFQGIGQDQYFYFVHSYYCDPASHRNVAGITEYGIPFCSAYAEGNLVATQFHPEKSGVIGLKIYQNYVLHAAEWASRGHPS